MSRKIVFYCVILSIAVMPSNAQTGKLRALVIGNGRYATGSAKSASLNLPMSSKDANAIGEALTENGFQSSEITILQNQTKPDLVRALSDFHKSIGEHDAVLFYFSGHGFALDGEDYIVPVGFPFGDDTKAATEAAVSLSFILSQIGNAQSRVVIWDACRDLLPSPKGLDSLSAEHFGQLVTPRDVRGTLVGFATSYGYATSGSSPSGLSYYTDALVKSLKKHPPNMMNAFLDAKDILTKADPDAPTPGIYSELQGDFVLAGAPLAAHSALPVSGPPGSNLYSRLQAYLSEIQTIENHYVNMPTLLTENSEKRRYDATRFGGTPLTAADEEDLITGEFAALVKNDEDMNKEYSAWRQRFGPLRQTVLACLQWQHSVEDKDNSTFDSASFAASATWDMIKIKRTKVDVKRFEPIAQYVDQLLKKLDANYACSRSLQ